MTGQERRRLIIEILLSSKDPIPGYKLADEFDVSRQVIVQDIALLRAERNNIMATSRGYLIYSNNNNLKKRVVATNHDSDKIEEELRTVVDYGGRLLNVIIEHDVYGDIKADLMIETENDIENFLEKMKENKALPLMALTNGEHYHTIEAKNDKILDIIEKELSSL